MKFWSYQNGSMRDISNPSSKIQFISTAATQPGNNYTSIMVRVTITIEVKGESDYFFIKSIHIILHLLLSYIDGSEMELSYIVKTTLDSDKGIDYLASMSLFFKEKQMYQAHIPNFTKIYKEAGVDIKLAPQCFHVDDTSERITLVLEDLSYMLHLRYASSRTELMITFILSRFILKAIVKSLRESLKCGNLLTSKPCGNGDYLMWSNILKRSHHRQSVLILEPQ